MRIYRGLHNTALLLYRYHKVKARSGTKAAARSNRYATDKRAAAAAGIETKSPRQLIPWEVRSYSALCCDAAGGFLIHTKLFALSFATLF